MAVINQNYMVSLEEAAQLIAHVPEVRHEMVRRASRVTN